MLWALLLLLLWPLLSGPLNISPRIKTSICDRERQRLLGAAGDRFVAQFRCCQTIVQRRRHSQHTHVRHTKMFYSNTSIVRSNRIMHFQAINLHCCVTHGNARHCRTLSVQHGGNCLWLAFRSAFLCTEGAARSTVVLQLGVLNHLGCQHRADV